MNAFACDRNPRNAAIALADRHLSARTTDAAKALSAAGMLLGTPVPGGWTQAPEHPLVLGCLESPDFRTWLCEHGLALASEFSFRFGHEHGAQHVIENAEFLSDESPPSPLTWLLADIPMLVHSEFRQHDPVDAYRGSLRSKYASWAARGAPPQWTRRGPPHWLHYLVRLGREAA